MLPLTAITELQKRLPHLRKRGEMQSFVLRLV
jgi:hypothetical protein